MPPDQPNILLITTDQQRYDTAGASGPSFLRTPHYDMLQRQGVTFTSAYSSCPICVPARTSIMTGKTAHHHGMTGNAPTAEYIRDDETLPALLNELGYHTALFGKAHFGPVGVRHGFQELRTPDTYWQEQQDRHQRRHGLGSNELYPARATVPEDETITSWIADQCADYIQQRRDQTRPFFAWCSFVKPHPPFDPPEPYYSMYDEAPIPDPVESDWSQSALPPILEGNGHTMCSINDSDTLRKARACYYGLITQIDYYLGRVFGALDDAGILDETLIIYTSDHGEYLGDHGLQWKIGFHEPSAHVPMVVRLPFERDDRHAGTTCESPVQLADILPTVAAAAGTEPPEPATGYDLVAIARGEAEGRAYAEGIGAMFTDTDYVGLTDGRWKYIYYADGPCEQLFDLENDPEETENLADDSSHEQTRRTLRSALRRQQVDRESAFVDDGELIAYDSDERADSTWASDPGSLTWEGYGI